MDALQLLIADHNRVRGLFKRFEAAEGENDAQAAKLAAMIFEELQVHTKIEEEVFYPAVMKLRSAWAKEAVREALEEHQAVDSIVAELDQMEPEDGQYDAKVHGLRASVQHHLGEEERAMFVEARNHLTDDRLQALGRRMVSLLEKMPAEVSFT